MYKFRFELPDVEYWDDFNIYEEEIIENDGKVSTKYWDGEDCGDAYIEYTTDTQEHGEEIYEKLEDL